MTHRPDRDDRGSPTAGRTLEESAKRLRAEARRVADVEHDLRTAVRGRTWSGPASERFERKVVRRLRELETQRDTLMFLAERLIEAAGQTRGSAAR